MEEISQRSWDALSLDVLKARYDGTLNNEMQ